MTDLLGAGILILYYLVVVVLVPTLLKAWLGIPRELARKFQHVAYALSIFLLLNLFSSWYMALLAAFSLVLLAFPFLLFVEKTAWYRRFLVDRTSQGGELRKQLLYVQLSFGVLILVFWGLLGAEWQYLAAVSVMGWGFGDAAAALVGKAFGRRRFIHRLIEGAKTREGTLAMILTAGVALFLTLLLYAGQPWYTSLLIALILAPVCGVVELFSKKGLDTLTVPLSTAALLLPLVYLLSLFGWVNI
jgi:phytol kinase